MESSFRRLLGAIEEERDQIRNTYQDLQSVRENVATSLTHLREETEDYCTNQKLLIDAEWKRLDRLSEKMAEFWHPQDEILKINCSNHIYEVPRSTMCGIEGSYLAQLFSEENAETIRPDADGFFYLDINPVCFGLVIEYLLNRRLRVDAPLPIVPQAQKLNMELLAEAWHLKPFLRENRINPVHTTSLHITQPNILESTHPGWQVISSQYPLPMANPHYFEVHVVGNPGAGTSGGLAIGVSGHIPQGKETHTIRLPGSVVYNSGLGVVDSGDVLVKTEDYQLHDQVKPEMMFAEGDVVGIRHDPASHSLQWYLNRKRLGTTVIREHLHDDFRLLWPVFALYVPGQRLQVDFRLEPQPALALEDR